MFSIDRYDPLQRGSEEKKNRLASLNDRLKRKRTKLNTEDISTHNPTAGMDHKARTISTEMNDTAQAESVDDSTGLRTTLPKQPHREKKKKPSATVVEVGDGDDQTKVAHILQKFHKIQDSAVKSDEPNTIDGTAESIGADLVPVPQVSRSVVKRPTVAAIAGLPKYLQEPRVVSTSTSAPFSQFSLSQKLQENLKKHEFENAFAVQAALLPALLGRHLPENRQDFLVSAPTGSGKTLTYVLTILQTLQTRRITRLRAVVIVPTRELVLQVQATFEALSSRLGLKLETLSATRPFAAEQSLLINDYEPTAASNVDILVCTPGRLVDHIKSTSRFTLRDLRFLVIDEGDRLLNQSFQGWSAEIDEALKPLRAEEEETTLDIFTTKSEERCQKLIFSATLSTDPSLLAQLHLINPVLYLVQDRESEEGGAADLVSKFTTPATLSEFFVHSPDGFAKPLVLLTLIHRMRVPKALVFTNSNESAIKLTSLMSRLDLGRCEAFTSTLTPSLRRRHLADFSADGGGGGHSSTQESTHATPIQFLVCSDLMARGIDTTVECVINYDSSISARQYIHRVGRTARAGKQGRAVSIVEGHEGKYWWNQIGRKIRRSREVLRVTLFPRSESASGARSAAEVDAAEGNIVGGGADDESDDSENDAGSGDDDADEDDDDDDDEMTLSSTSDQFDPRQEQQGRPSLSDTDMDTDVPRGQTRPAASPAVSLADVDGSGLRQLYERALASLQVGVIRTSLA